MTGRCRIPGTRSCRRWSTSRSWAAAWDRWWVKRSRWRSNTRSTARSRPVVSVVASGGARMQEGMLSLVEIAKTAAAARRAHDAHVPYISVFMNPTTGGIYASFASQGDIILAEPEALIARRPARDRGRRARRRGAGAPHAQRRVPVRAGYVDAIVERPKLRTTVSTILRLIGWGLPRQRAAHGHRSHRAHPSTWPGTRASGATPGTTTTLDYIQLQ